MARRWAGLFPALLLVPVESMVAQQPTDTSAGAPGLGYELKQRERVAQKRAYQERRKAIEAEIRATAERIAPVRKELDSLLAACAKRNLPTDYERIVVDLRRDAPEYGGYAPELESAAAAVSRLRAYLAGTATPFRTPRYVTQKLKSD